REEYELDALLFCSLKGLGRTNWVNGQGEDHARRLRHDRLDIAELLCRIEPGICGCHNFDPSSIELMDSACRDSGDEIRRGMPDKCCRILAFLELCHLCIGQCECAGRGRSLTIGTDSLRRGQAWIAQHNDAAKRDGQE